MAGITAGVINKPNGYAQYTDLAAAHVLTDTPAAGVVLPDSSIRALIQAEAQDVRWTDDGTTTPTATVGMLLKNGVTLEYEGDLNKFKFIQAAASGKLNVSYYKY